MNEYLPEASIFGHDCNHWYCWFVAAYRCLLHSPTCKSNCMLLGHCLLSYSGSSNTYHAGDTHVTVKESKKIVKVHKFCKFEYLKFYQRLAQLGLSITFLKTCYKGLYIYIIDNHSISCSWQWGSLPFVATGRW